MQMEILCSPTLLLLKRTVSNSVGCRYQYIFICILMLRLNMAVALSSSTMGLGGTPRKTGDRPVCLYYMSDEVKNPDSLSGGDQLLGDGTVLCDAPSDYCFSFWRNDNSSLEDKAERALGPQADDSGFIWLARGCFKNAHHCDINTCIATRERESSFFCCCKGDRCNEKISIQEATHVPMVVPEPVIEASPLDTLWQTSIILIACSFIIFIFLIFWKFRKCKKSLSSNSIGLSKSPTSPCIDLNNLTFLEMLGQGRYGTAYKALLRDEEVAVKLFTNDHKQSFMNEKYIYSLPLMEHPNLLSYFGGGEVLGPDHNSYLGLVLSYCPKGSLSSYLHDNTLDWPTFCRVVITTVKGLGHLHSDVRKGDLVKPCVAHRDFNTRNILLKADMSCVVSDLGFAIHTQGARFYQNGEEQIAEMASLTDVGTLRYMAPEVLEGALNLRDCETSLKQIDIYALGLVLWEVAYRCHDLYQGAPTPNYALPFEAEIGLRPTLEHMQVLVARNKARPLFPQIWKDSSPALKQLKETIEDCWDNDAEARLSAMCVERRLIELPKLWSRYKASLGLNTISPSTNPPSNGNIFNSSDLKGFVISNELSLNKDRADHVSNRESSVSENTVETTLPFSPSDPSGRLLGKNHLLEAVNAPPLPPIQPHQGRNPCLERNTISEHSKELQISEKDLVETSRKYPYSNFELGLNSASLLEALESQHAIDPEIMNEHLMPLINSFLPSSAAPRPHLSQDATFAPSPLPITSSQVPPIPYLQNEMRIGEGRPKLQNVERKGAAPGETGGTLRRLWRAAFRGDRLVPLLKRRKGGNRGQGFEDEEKGILVTPTSSGFCEPLTPMDQNTSCLQTQVLIANGAPHTTLLPAGEDNSGVVLTPATPVTPTPVPYTETLRGPYSGVDVFTASCTLPNPSRVSSSAQAQRAPGHVAETEIGIAKLLHQGSTPVIRSRQGSKDSGINVNKSSENSNNSFNSFIDSDSSLERGSNPRPTTLLLPRLRQEVSSSEDIPGGDAPHHITLRKAKQRVKTPMRPKAPSAARLSLYDDSIITNGVGLLQQGGDTHLEDAFSRSLPLNMNNVGNKSGPGLGDGSGSGLSSHFNSSSGAESSERCGESSMGGNSENSLYVKGPTSPICVLTSSGIGVRGESR